MQPCRTSFADVGARLATPPPSPSLMMRIEAAGGTVKIVETILASQRDHLVLIGPAASQAALAGCAMSCARQSIPNQLISEGRFAAALSVGVFADLSVANAFQAELAALGYRVRVETLDSRRTAYHLQAQTPRKPPAFAMPATACPGRFDRGLRIGDPSWTSGQAVVGAPAAARGGSPPHGANLKRFVVDTPRIVDYIVLQDVAIIWFVRSCADIAKVLAPSLDRQVILITRSASVRGRGPLGRGG